MSQESSALLGDRPMLLALGSERGENKRGGLGTLPKVPVGGHPGNDHFYEVVQMAVRLTVMCLLIGCMVWMPEATKSIGMDRFAKHAGLAACLMCFFATFTIGGVLNTASAGVTGCFTATFNTFILRGFFPDGVTPGVPFTASVSLVGWANLAIFNFLVLFLNFRMGYRMTAMALNTSFMMCFLNPNDQTVFSKNFQININGAAVSAFLGVCIGSLCAVLAVALPYPLGFATANMKVNGKIASEDTCKLFIAAVKYFKGTSSNVLIERQMAQSKKLGAHIGGLGGMINDAYIENLDVATQGTIRVLYEKHSSMMGQIFDVLQALQFAMSTEDFGPSHVECMNAIGEEAHDLVDAACVVLLAATAASEDGDIDAREAADLLAKEENALRAMAALSEAFDGMRKRFGKPVCKELANESFFVFCISAFARLSVDYAKVLRTDPPKGCPFVGELVNSMRGLTDVPVWFHYRIVARYWCSLALGFLFSVHLDNYVPSCAITCVFLINTRVGPDVMAMIQGLLAVVVGIVSNALMFSFSCKFGNTTSLMCVAVVYWLATLTVGKGSSSLAGIGLLMAALSPFALYKFCIPDTPEAAAASAVGLWGGIRALLIAVVITVLMEFAFVPGRFTKLARNALNDAFLSMQKAFGSIFAEHDIANAKANINTALAEVSTALADAEMYNAACIMEPRLSMCPWKSQFLGETCGHLAKVRLDVLLIKQALCGLDGRMDLMVELLMKVPEVKHIKADLDSTLEDARELAIGLLDHESGKFKGLNNLDSIEGIDTLDGYDEALEHQCKVVSFPRKAPECPEDDECIRLSIVYVMLEYLIGHLSDVLKGGVRRS
jgi:hypothetical protein